MEGQVFKSEDLRVNYTKDKEITQARAEKEEKVKKCLTFLGIKETYILDHLDSNF